jgi:hypothetical protein
MKSDTLTRRDLVRLALAGGAAILVAGDNVASADSPSPAPVVPVVPAPPAIKNEGDAMIQALPLNTGYALTTGQATEAGAQLSGYPGAFASVRSYAIADDVLPAITPVLPGRPQRKGRRK